MCGSTCVTAGERARCPPNVARKPTHSACAPSVRTVAKKSSGQRPVAAYYATRPMSLLALRLGSIIVLCACAISCGSEDNCELTDGECPEGCSAVPGFRYDPEGQCRETIPLAECTEPSNDEGAPLENVCRVNTSSGDIVWFSAGNVYAARPPTWRECTSVEHTKSAVMQCQ